MEKASKAIHHLEKLAKSVKKYQKKKGEMGELARTILGVYWNLLETEKAKEELVEKWCQTCHEKLKLALQVSSPKRGIKVRRKAGLKFNIAGEIIPQTVYTLI